MCERLLFCHEKVGLDLSTLERQAGSRGDWRGAWSLGKGQLRTGVESEIKLRKEVLEVQLQHSVWWPSLEFVWSDFKDLLKTRGVIKVLWKKGKKSSFRKKPSAGSGWLAAQYMLHCFCSQSAEIDGGHQRDKLLLHTFMDVKTKITAKLLLHSYRKAITSQEVKHNH